MRLTETSPLAERVSFHMVAASAARRADGYPTGALAHGPHLLLDGRDLTEEGVGFGVPVALRGLAAVFPGSVAAAVSDPLGDVDPCAADSVEYRLDLAERLVRAPASARATGRSPRRRAPDGRPIDPSLLDRAHDRLSRLHRERPSTRPALDAGSTVLRRALRLTTRFTPTSPAGDAVVRYASPAPGALCVTVDPRGITDPGVTGLAMMNEAGAGFFRVYRDSTGLRLADDAIGSWAEVRAAWAALAAPALGLEMLAAPVPGARLFRGRELSPGRLAWAGFAHLLAPPWEPFSYFLHVRPIGGADGAAARARLADPMTSGGGWRR